MARLIAPDVHLARASRLVKVAAWAMTGHRENLMGPEGTGPEATGTGGPIFASINSIFSDTSPMKEHEASIASGLEMAEREVSTAIFIGSQPHTCQQDAGLNPQQLRANIAYLTGQLEMIGGNSDEAKRLLLRSTRLHGLADAHYLLGILYERDYEPQQALKHFEKCLELDHAGGLRVPALRQCAAMKNYKKKFRGSWAVLALFALLILSSASALTISPTAGVLLLALWAGAGGFYWKYKYK